jgi:lipopolysaccharide/colanic/teichoic acid biosynthesis glycosyltransferase
LIKQAARSVGDLYFAGGRGLDLVTTAVAVVAMIIGIKTSLGLEGPAGILVPILILLVTGSIEREIRREMTRRRLRQTTLKRRDHPETTLDPVRDVGVRPWLGGGPSGSSTGLSPFVERQAMNGVEKGLARRRFVILVGPETSGKSRLAYEAAVRWSQVTLIAAPLPRHGGDPLVDLMNDRRGFPAMENDQILFLTDIAKRVEEGWISGEHVRRWLKRNPRISIIATLRTKERDAIDAADWEGLKQEAKIVTIGKRLSGKALEEAKRKYPHIEQSQLPELTTYLASGPPLRDALREADDDGVNALGRSIVCAVADWKRAGIARPAPLKFVQQIVRRFHDDMDEEQFREELNWALMPRAPAAALVYRAEESDEEAFAPDPIVAELFDRGELQRPVPDHTWHIAKYCLHHRVGAPGLEASEVGRELAALGRTALQRGNHDIAYPTLEEASRLSDFEEHQEIGQTVITERDSSLVNSRRGDRVFQRLRPIKALAEGRRFQAGDPLLESSPRSGRTFAWIYRLHSLRSLVRIIILGVADVSSTLVGLLVGLWLQSRLTDAPGPLSADRPITGAFLGIWAAVTVFVFSWARLYRKDAARARLSAVAGAIALVTLFAWISTLTDGRAALQSAAAAAVGALAALTMDLLLRFAYDVVSRNWVEKHGLEARTLLVGPPEQVATIERALKGISRPSVVVGYLSDEPAPESKGPGLPKTTRFGRPSELGGIARRVGVGRVILTDPAIDPQERQQLADSCHERGLLVEARASLLDIRVGSAPFVLGQPLVLIQLLPLWQRNVWFFVKRAFDFTVSLLALLLLGIPLLIIWACVCLQERPGLIRTLRIGVGGESFYMLRLRAAKGEPGARLDLLEDEEAEEPRYTRLGQVLRTKGINEFPQLINVLRGQMSLVGPRPLELKHHVRLDDMELQRYVVRPGATGPWQVCRQTKLTYSELTALDMAYLRKWSFLVDLEILVRTFWLVLTRRELPQLVPSERESLQEGPSPN